MSYTPEFIADLDRILTRNRLARYLAATGGDLEQALRLYEKNMALAEALFGFLHGLEVVVRNSLHHAMSADAGIEDWYQDGLALPFSPLRTLSLTAPMREMVAKARRNAGAGAPVGKLIAELTFGFWPFLISSQFHMLWSVTLHKAFPHAHVPRSFVHSRLETIQRLRNRIAHHEPILSSKNEVYTGHAQRPTIALAQILECVAWCSTPAAGWLRSTTRYDRALQILNEVACSGVVL